MNNSIHITSNSALKEEAPKNPFRTICSFAGKAWTWLKENLSLFPYERTATKIYDLSNKIHLETYGRAKNPASPNKSDTDLIARTVMRYPNKQATEALSKLHGALKSKLLSYNDDTLKWLLGGSSKNARGGFKDVEDLKTFLNADPAKISSSRLMMGLNTLIAAIAYRYIGKGEDPKIPETEEAQGFYNDLRKMSAYYIPDHAETYADSRICVMQSYEPKFYETLQGSENENVFATSLRDDISIASHAPDAPIGDRVGGAIFAKRYEINGLQTSTWVGAARAGNIPVRLSISGSAIHSLAAIEWILGGKPGELDEKSLELFAGTIIVPTYHRGDYHSVAETGAAFQHYISTRPGGNPLKAALIPINAMKTGLSLMEKAVDDLRKKPVREGIAKVLATAKEVSYKLPEELAFMRLFRH